MPRICVMFMRCSELHCRDRSLLFTQRKASALLITAGPSPSLLLAFKKSDSRHTGISSRNVRWVSKSIKPGLSRVLRSAGRPQGKLTLGTGPGSTHTMETVSKCQIKDCQTQPQPRSSHPDQTPNSKEQSVKTLYFQRLPLR